MTDPVWRLQLLGRINLVGGDAAAAERVLVQPKHIGLLAYLVVDAAVIVRADGQGEPAMHYRRRDELAALFWPELDQAHARASLRRVVHHVRGALGGEVLASRGDEEIGVDERFLASDVCEFARAIASNRLAAALELWRGELMPGFHLAGCGELQHRLDDQRAALRDDAAAAAWLLAQQFEAQDEPTLATRWARRVPKFAPDDERVLRRTLAMLSRLGDRAGALRLYDDFARRLRSEFEAEPSEETRALVKAIRG